MKDSSPSLRSGLEWEGVVKGKMTVDIKTGDIVRLRKAHPCGSYDWEVVRVGADIGIKCLKCQRRVLLERNVFKRRLKTIVPKNNCPSAEKGG